MARNHQGNDEESKVLYYLLENKTATADDVEINCGGKWTLRKLQQKGLIQELTT